MCSFAKLNFYKWSLHLKHQQKCQAFHVYMNSLALNKKWVFRFFCTSGIVIAIKHSFYRNSVSVSSIKFCEFPEFDLLYLHNMQLNRNEKLPNTQTKYLDIIFRVAYISRQKLYLIAYTFLDSRIDQFYKIQL